MFRSHQLHAAYPGWASNHTEQLQACNTIPKHRHKTRTAPSALGALGMGLRGRSYIHYATQEPQLGAGTQADPKPTGIPGKMLAKQQYKTDQASQTGRLLKGYLQPSHS